MTQQELRRIRLKSDYAEMQKIQNQPYASWRATKGEAPFVEEYELTVNVRTYCAPEKTMNRCVIRITLPRNYPMSPPDAKMISTPLVFHPHWFTTGTYCPGAKRKVTESLLQYVRRMIMTLQNEPEYVDPDSPANEQALKWYLNNRNNSRLFPSDHTKLTEKKSGFVVKKKTFS